jgi:hypothetical protein
MAQFHACYDLPFRTDKLRIRVDTLLTHRKLHDMLLW